MNCEKCGTGMQTKDTRKIDSGVWRKRVCPACGEVMTTLEQKCVTLANPYRNGKTGEFVAGLAMALATTPEVQRPNPPEKRSKATRKPKAKFVPPAEPAENGPCRPNWVKYDKPTPAKPAPRPPTGTPFPPRADFAPPKPAHHWTVPARADVPVDRLTPTARDRIEDMKAERDTATYGWD